MIKGILWVAAGFGFGSFTTMIYMPSWVKNATQDLQTYAEKLKSEP